MTSCFTSCVRDILVDILCDILCEIILTSCVTFYVSSCVPKLLPQEAERARRQYDISMVAVGVEEEQFEKELVDMVGVEHRDSRVFTVENFAQLNSVVDSLKHIICESINISLTLDFGPKWVRLPQMGQIWAF